MHWSIDDAHVYDRHIDALKDQLSQPVPDSEPTLVLPDKFDADGNQRSFFERRMSDAKLEGYENNGVIKYEIAE